MPYRLCFRSDGVGEMAAKIEPITYPQTYSMNEQIHAAANGDILELKRYNYNEASIPE